MKKLGDKLSDSLLTRFELEKEKARNKAILDSIGEGLIIADYDGRVTFINPRAEEMIGWRIDEIIDKPLFEILPVEDRYGNIKALEDQPIHMALRRKDKVIASGPIFYVRKNKTKFPVAITISPIILSEKILGVIEVFRDVSKEFELQKAREEFISFSTHQLRSPVTTIAGNAELLLEGSGQKLDASELESLKSIFQAARERLLPLINAMLNSLRVELGTVAIEPHPTDLAKSIDAVLNELSAQIQNKQLIIEKKYDNLLPINVDPLLTHAVFQNIIVNAVKYSQIQKKIGIALLKKDENILFIVSDSGCGIPQEEQPNIFQKLYRASNVQSIDPDGTGIGLYLIKSILDQAGGKIWFESEENKGTTFYVSIPTSGMKKRDGTKGLQ